MQEVSTAIAWLRKQIEDDLSAAKTIGPGGFMPESWRTDPPGQVNPDGHPASPAVSAALDIDHAEDMPWGWVPLYAWNRLNDEPPEADGREDDKPVILADGGRRHFDHIVRHDPRNAVADCEAKLALLDEMDAAVRRSDAVDTIELDFYLAHDLRKLLASAYRHRPGYAEHWSAP